MRRRSFTHCTGSQHQYPSPHQPRSSYFLQDRYLWTSFSRRTCHCHWRVIVWIVLATCVVTDTSTMLPPVGTGDVEGGRPTGARRSSSSILLPRPPSSSFDVENDVVDSQLFVEEDSNNDDDDRSHRSSNATTTKPSYELSPTDRPTTRRTRSRRRRMLNSRILFDLARQSSTEKVSQSLQYMRRIYSRMH